MENRDHIQKELLEISPVVANLQMTHVYSVPYLYFENLPQIILQKVKDEENAVYDFSMEMPYTVPRNYFENLSANILQKVQANEFYDELQEVAPLLNTISKSPVYSVPANYFQNNIGILSIPEKSKSQAKVVQIFSTSKFIKYAAAAVITGIIAVSSWLLLNKESTTTQISTTTFAASDLQELSEGEIIEYLKNYTPAIDVTNATYNTPHTEGQLDEYLDEMTDEEIQKYLNETAEPGEKKLKEINS